MVATLNANPSATIISCYSPTNVSEETDLIAFYDELSSLVRSIPKHNVLNTKAQIDYVFINKKWNNSALNCKAYSSFEVVLRSPNCHGKNTTEPMKEYNPNNNNNNRTLWLVPA